MEVGQALEGQDEGREGVGQARVQLVSFVGAILSG